MAKKKTEKENDYIKEYLKAADELTEVLALDPPIPSTEKEMEEFPEKYDEEIDEYNIESLKKDLAKEGQYLEDRHKAELSPETKAVLAKLGVNVESAKNLVEEAKERVAEKREAKVETKKAPVVKATKKEKAKSAPPPKPKKTEKAKPEKSDERDVFGRIPGTQGALLDTLLLKGSKKETILKALKDAQCLHPAARLSVHLAWLKKEKGAQITVKGDVYSAAVGKK